MDRLSSKDLDLFSNKILEDYDSKNPSSIFKDKIKITNEDALIIQSNVARLRVNRGDQIIGYKIGCVSKDTQKKISRRGCMHWLTPSTNISIFGEHQNAGWFFQIVYALPHFSKLPGRCVTSL